LPLPEGPWADAERKKGRRAMRVGRGSCMVAVVQSGVKARRNCVGFLRSERWI